MDQTSLSILDRGLTPRQARNLLWCPAYASMVDEGMPDYRDMMDCLFLTTLGSYIAPDGSILDIPKTLPSFRPEIFPPSMGEVHTILTNALYSILEFVRKDNYRLFVSEYPQLMHNLPLNVAINFDFLINNAHETTFLYIDPFPSDSPWAMSPTELQLLLPLIEWVKTSFAERNNQRQLVTGVMNIHSAKLVRGAGTITELNDMLYVAHAMKGNTNPDQYTSIIKELRTWTG